MPYLSKITLYPFKSLDGCEVEQATLLASGALQWDRAFALVDQQGLYMNGKRNAKIHQIRSHFACSEQLLTVRVGSETKARTFHVEHEREQLADWFSEYFGQPVSLEENMAHGFPDDTLAPGPTIIGTSTLASVADWFPATAETTFRRRFRANLEIAGVEPFWEDRLYGAAGTTVSFRIGSVLFAGSNPCKRCVVPSRDPDSGEIIPRFQKIFAQKRAETLPAWAERSRFDHFYRLAVNTRVPVTEAGKELHLGDEVELTD